jgi:hypothetical protein
MERFGFRARLEVGLINLCQYFVVDWTPPIILKSEVPTVMVVILRFIVVDIDSLFSSFFLHLHVVTRSKRVDVHDTSMTKDFVVDQRREFDTAKSEPHMAFRCCIQQTSLGWINRF